MAHGQPLIRPPETKQLDYEGEIALVIGKRGRRIARAAAMGHVLGYTAANEGTVREWTRHGKFNVTQGKNFDRSGSIGPWIVTADAAPAGPLRVKTRVNGEERQNDTTDRLLFPFDFLISYLSTFTTLEPGDMILTGTPNGAGARFNPPKWLVPGDVVEVEIEGMGVLSNPVAERIRRVQSGVARLHRIAPIGAMPLRRIAPYVARYARAWQAPQPCPNIAAYRQSKWVSPMSRCEPLSLQPCWQCGAPPSPPPTTSGRWWTRTSTTATTPGTCCRRPRP